MAEHRQRAEWDRTASLMALVANLVPDPRRTPDPYEPADFHPFVSRPNPPEELGWQLLRAIAGKHD